MHLQTLGNEEGGKGQLTSSTKVYATVVVHFQDVIARSDTIEVIVGVHGIVIGVESLRRRRQCGLDRGEVFVRGFRHLSLRKRGVVCGGGG